MIQYLLGMLVIIVANIREPLHAQQASQAWPTHYSSLLIAIPWKVSMYLAPQSLTTFHKFFHYCQQQECPISESIQNKIYDFVTTKLAEKIQQSLSIDLLSLFRILEADLSEEELNLLSQQSSIEAALCMKIEKSVMNPQTHCLCIPIPNDVLASAKDTTKKLLADSAFIEEILLMINHERTHE